VTNFEGEELSSFEAFNQFMPTSRAFDQAYEQSRFVNPLAQNGVTRNSIITKVFEIVSISDARKVGIYTNSFRKSRSSLDLTLGTPAVGQGLPIAVFQIVDGLQTTRWNCQQPDRLNNWVEP
jgi:hypothetical protein